MDVKESLILNKILTETNLKGLSAGPFIGPNNIPLWYIGGQWHDMDCPISDYENADIILGEINTWLKSKLEDK
jgi:hypothetical protein